MNNGKHGQGTHSTKMGPAENTSNACPRPKVPDFLKIWVSVVRVLPHAVWLICEFYGPSSVPHMKCKSAHFGVGDVL